MANFNYKYKVLVTAPYLQRVFKDYHPIFTSHGIEVILPKLEQKLSETELLQYIGDVDGIICGDDQITEAVLAQAPRLKVISKWGTGTDAIDKEAAARYGIPVKNTPNAFTEAVADTVLSFALCFARKTLELNEKMHRGIWSKEPALALNECVLGVIGMGNIGKAVVKRAKAFGMKVLCHDIHDVPDFELASLEQLLKESDFVSLNCTLDKTSYHLINKEKLALMKPTAYLINTSRGALVDEKALIEALEKRQIAGAGLDVFEDEPLPKDSPLRKFPNVILSPHNANASQAVWKKVHENTINNLIEELIK